MSALILVPGVNPVPLTVTMIPVGPCVGVSEIAGIVTVNDAVALSEPPSDPVAVTVYVAAAPLTVNVQPLNVPAPVALHELADPIVPPAVIVNVIATPGVNPLPDAVTVTPLGPCVGVSEITGVVIVNGAVALSEPPSDPVAVTVYRRPGRCSGDCYRATERPGPRRRCAARADCRTRSDRCRDRYAVSEPGSRYPDRHAIRAPRRSERDRRYRDREGCRRFVEAAVRPRRRYRGP